MARESQVVYWLTITFGFTLVLSSHQFCANRSGTLGTRDEQKLTKAKTKAVKGEDEVNRFRSRS